MKFHDLTVSLTGDRFSARVQDATALVPGAVAAFDDFVADGYDRRPLPAPCPPGLTATWVPDAGCGVVTFWSGGVPVTTSVIATGEDPAAEAAVFRQVAAMAAGVLRAASGGAAEPAFDLLAVKERPVLASVVLFGPPFVPAGVLALVADLETCFAAAYFLNEGPR